MIQIKRVYEAPSEQDGYRLLVDRIWPRGVSKDKAKLDAWNKEISPSTELRKWFHAHTDQFDVFIAKYHEELTSNPEVMAQLEELAKLSQTQTLTLLYGAKDEKHNQAIVLAAFLRERLGV